MLEVRSLKSSYQPGSSFWKLSPLWSLQGDLSLAFLNFGCCQQSLTWRHISPISAPSSYATLPMCMSLCLFFFFLKGSHLLIQTPVQPHLNLIVSAKTPVQIQSRSQMPWVGTSTFHFGGQHSTHSRASFQYSWLQEPKLHHQALSSCCSDWLSDGRDIAGQGYKYVMVVQVGLGREVALNSSYILCTWMLRGIVSQERGH